MARTSVRPLHGQQLAKRTHSQELRAFAGRSCGPPRCRANLFGSKPAEHTHICQNCGPSRSEAAARRAVARTRSSRSLRSTRMFIKVASLHCGRLRPADVCDVASWVRSAAGCRTCSSTIRQRRRRATSDARFAVRRMGAAANGTHFRAPSNHPSPTARNGARPREEIGRLPVIRTFYLRTLHAAAKTAPYTGQNFERQTNHGLRRSSSL